MTVYDAEGAKVSGATVTTIPASSSASTATDGTGTLSGVPIGTMFVTANKTGFKADGTQVTLVANGTATASLFLETGSEFALARVVGIPSGYTDTLPAGETRLTSSAPGYDIKVNGVANVPLKQFVYVQAAEEDASGNAITGQTWALSGSDIGSKATLEYWDGTSKPRVWDTTSTGAADVRFRPDVPGMYTVTVTATSSGGTSTYHLKVYAGTYVGAAWCASCHSNAEVVGEGRDVYASWSLTGHATKFQTTYGSYSAARDYCVQCHVTGYDESTLSGFDDLAVESGWDPGAGSFLAWAKARWSTVGAFVAEPATRSMQKLMNIQCEACHGPGSNHPSAESHLSWSPAVCAQCHGQPAQWALSKHSNLAQPSHQGSSSCMPCHSGQGFVVAKVQKKPIVFPDQSFPGYPATVFEKGMIQPIGCVTCHDPHLGTGTKSSQLRMESTSYTAPMGFTVTAAESAACKTCHVNKRDTTYFSQYMAGNQSRGPHMTQTDMLSGKGGAEFSGKSYGSSSHTSVSSECIECHMYTGTYAPTCNVDVACPGTLTCSSTTTTNGTCGCKTNDDCTNPGQVCSHSKCTDQSFGGHTFNMSFTDDSNVRHDHVDVCSQCHNVSSWTSFDGKTVSNYAGGGTGTGVQTQIDALVARLGSRLMFGGASVPDSGYDKMSPRPTATQLQALWNYWYVVNDGSHGVHNTRYAVQLLCDSLQALDSAAACATRP